MTKIEKLRTEAEAWVKKHGPSGIIGLFPSRTCWHCNTAHAWMKKDKETPYQCFECGHVYFKGERLTEEDTPNMKADLRTGGATARVRARQSYHTNQLMRRTCG